MAGDNFTRSEFDLSPWRETGPLTLFQAAWLWAGIPPTLPTTAENEKRFPAELAAARGWYGRLEKAAKAGDLAYEKPSATRPVQVTRGRAGSSYLGTPSQPATYRDDEDWPATRVSLAELRRYAESIGQRPGFLFAGGPVVFLSQGAPDSGASEPPEKWAQGIRCVAFDAAKAIIARGDKLTADGLENQMLESKMVELKSDEYILRSTDGNLNDREMKAKPKTIAGWATDLKKLLKQ